MLMYVRRLNNYQNSLLSPFFGIFEDFHFFHLRGLINANAKYIASKHHPSLQSNQTP